MHILSQKLSLKSCQSYNCSPILIQMLIHFHYCNGWILQHLHCQEVFTILSSVFLNTLLLTYSQFITYCLGLHLKFKHIFSITSETFCNYTDFNSIGSLENKFIKFLRVVEKPFLHHEFDLKIIYSFSDKKMLKSRLHLKESG